MADQPRVPTRLLLVGAGGDSISLCSELHRAAAIQLSMTKDLETAAALLAKKDAGNSGFDVVVVCDDAVELSLRGLRRLTPIVARFGGRCVLGVTDSEIVAAAMKGAGIQIFSTYKVQGFRRCLSEFVLRNW